MGTGGASTSPPPRALAVDPSRIRNLCVLAHVDHGKTALTDALIASSGVISTRLAGRVRYLDSREDEQQRGITMKSSAIALGHRVRGAPAAAAGATAGATRRSGGDDKGVAAAAAAAEGPLHVINVIDSPGHVDFTGEVDVALRVSDGALLVVDVVEGVCVQTVAVLRAALDRRVVPLLVLNKIDRLHSELHLSPSEAYAHLARVLEQVNVVMGVQEAEEMLKQADQDVDADRKAGAASLADGAAADEEAAGSVTFSPELGNVVFASALDGWAFRVSHFADIYAAKFGMPRDALRATLWGDYYLNPKTKRIVKRRRMQTADEAAGGRGGGGGGGGGVGGGGGDLGGKPMFVQFVLDNLWAVYDGVLGKAADALAAGLPPGGADPRPRDVQLAVRDKMVTRLGLAVESRDLRHRDARVAIHAIMAAWLPAASALLDAIVEELPSPAGAQGGERLSLLWPHTAEAAAAAAAAGAGATCEGGGEGGTGDVAAARHGGGTDGDGDPGGGTTADSAGCDGDTCVGVAPPVADLPGLAVRRQAAALEACAADAWPAADPKAGSTPLLDDALRGAPPPLLALVTKMVAPVDDTGAAMVTPKMATPRSRTVDAPAEADATNGAKAADASVKAERVAAAAATTPASGNEALASAAATAAAAAAAEEADMEAALPPLTALTRVFAGVLRVGDTVHVYGPRYSAAAAAAAVAQGAPPPHVAIATVTALYLLMGREMEAVASVSAGLLCGVAGLDKVVLKTASLSSLPPGPARPFAVDGAGGGGGSSGDGTGGGAGATDGGVVRVALEPYAPNDMRRLTAGLRRLHAADAAVEVARGRGGQLTLAAAGELHLERCLADLRDRFARGVRVVVSPPMVAYRETVAGGEGEHPQPEQRRGGGGGSGGTVGGAVPLVGAGGGDGTPDAVAGADADAAAPLTADERASLPAALALGRVEAAVVGGICVRLAVAPLPPRLAGVLDAAAPRMRGVSSSSGGGGGGGDGDGGDGGGGGGGELPQAGRLGGDADTQQRLRRRLAAALAADAADPEVVGSAVAAAGEAWLTGLRRLLADRVWAAGPRGFGANVLVGPPAGGKGGGAEGAHAVGGDSVAALFASADAPAVAGATAAVDAADAPLSPADDAGGGGTDVVAVRLLRDVRRCVVSGFQLATAAGPLCEEPLHAVAVVVLSVTVGGVGGGGGGGGGGGDSRDGPPPAAAVPAGPLMNGVREATRRAILGANPRIAEAQLAVTVQVSADGLGGTYNVLGRRRGRVTREALVDDRSSVFVVDAEVPVGASFGFADDLRKTTSGVARPQMVFSRWAAVAADPYWVPSTEEEREELGLEDGTAAGNNLARQLVTAVRKRKGLLVEERIVDKAEKQRTLARKK